MNKKWSVGIDFQGKSMLCVALRRGVTNSVIRERREFIINREGIRGLEDWLSGISEEHGPAEIAFEPGAPGHHCVIQVLRDDHEPVAVDPGLLLIEDDPFIYAEMLAEFVLGIKKDGHLDVGEINERLCEELGEEVRHD